MKTLKIDETYSIVYDENNNDIPRYVERYDCRHANIDHTTPNWITSMFYTLLEKEQEKDTIDKANEEFSDWEMWAEGNVV